MAPPTERPPRVPALEPSPVRRAAFARGLSAESRAALLLIAKGYRIAARRWTMRAIEAGLLSVDCLKASHTSVHAA